MHQQQKNIQFSSLQFRTNRIEKSKDGRSRSTPQIYCVSVERKVPANEAALVLFHRRFFSRIYALIKLLMVCIKTSIAKQGFRCQKLGSTQDQPRFPDALYCLATPLVPGSSSRRRSSGLAIATRDYKINFHR